MTIATTAINNRLQQSELTQSSTETKPVRYESL